MTTQYSRFDTTVLITPPEKSLPIQFDTSASTTKESPSPQSTDSDSESDLLSAKGHQEENKVGANN